MIRLLPFILIPILLIGALGWWRYQAAKQSLTTSQTQEQDLRAPIEVPKTLPGASVEDRVKSLEDSVTKLINQVNSLKSSGSSTTNSDTRLFSVEGGITELKARVSSLEKTSPAPTAAGSKAPLYIPLGAAGGPWGSQDWNTINDYEASINSDSYSGYSNMQLEVIFRLTEAAGTGSVRLFNATDNSSISSEVNTTSTSFGLKTSGNFNLPSGTKTYKLQVKSTQGKDLFIQSVRIKISF